MEHQGLSAQAKATLVVAGVVIVCAAVAIGVNGYYKKVHTKLKQELEQVRKQHDEIMGLVAQRGEWEQRANEVDTALRRYYTVVRDRDAVAPGEFQSEVITETEFESRLLRNLEHLAEATKCTLVSVEPGVYNKRKVIPRPKPKNDTPEERKRADDEWNAKTPEEKARIERDEQYTKRYGEITRVTEIKTLRLVVRGTLDKLQMFVGGLSYYSVVSPGAPDWRFPQLVAVTNVSLRPISGKDQDNGLKPGTDPVLEATITARYFQPKPLDPRLLRPQEGLPAAGGAEQLPAEDISAAF